MSYGNGNQSVRTPSVVVGWAIREIGSLLVSCLLAMFLVAIAVGGLLAGCAACGVSGGGPLSVPMTGMISSVSLGAFLGVYKAIRIKTRPSSLTTVVATTSGRTSLLYDRDLDGWPS